MHVQNKRNAFSPYGNYVTLCCGSFTLNTSKDNQLLYLLIVVFLPSALMIILSWNLLSLSVSQILLVVFLASNVICIYYLLRTTFMDPGIEIKQNTSEPYIPEQTETERRVSGLMSCLKNGRIDLFSRALKQTPSYINEPNSEGRCFIHIAVFSNKPELVATVLNYRPDILKRDYYNLTSLHYAAYNKNNEICKMLLTYLGIASVYREMYLQRFLYEIVAILPTYDIYQDRYWIRVNEKIVYLDSIECWQYTSPSYTIYASKHMKVEYGYYETLTRGSSTPYGSFSQADSSPLGSFRLSISECSAEIPSDDSEIANLHQNGDLESGAYAIDQPLLYYFDSDTNTSFEMDPKMEKSAYTDCSVKPLSESSNRLLISFRGHTGTETSRSRINSLSDNCAVGITDMSPYDLSPLYDAKNASSSEEGEHSMNSNKTRLLCSFICVNEGNIVTIKRCPICHIYMSPRVFHCRTCNCCIRGFDHHCPWIGNCIGIRNHLYFVLFLLSAFFTVLLGFYLSCSCIVASIAECYIEKSYFDFIWTIKSCWPDIVYFLCAVIMVAPLSNMLFTHLQLISRNCTTHEEISLPAKRIRKQNAIPMDLFYPYNHGFLNNWMYTFQTVNIQSHIQ